MKGHRMTADELPNIGAPARRALAAIDVTTLTQVATWTEAELLALHGVGPNAIRILRKALQAGGAEFRSEDRSSRF